MAYEKGYVQVMTETDTEAEFYIEGSGMILVTGVSGTWTLFLVAPDNELIELASITANYQQTYQNAPADTKLKLAGGTQGAKAWKGIGVSDSAGLSI